MVDIYDQFKDFKAFEVVFLDQESKPQKLFCTVKSIETSSIIIDANNKENENIFAELGDELKLHIYTENGVYSATSKVLRADKGILNSEYEIAYPTNSKHSQRREYFRADLGVEFKMKIIIDKKTGESLNVDAKTRNICGKGMSFTFDRDIENYDDIEIDLFFNEKSINTKAKLVYSKQVVTGNHPKFILAFTFTTIPAKDIDFIIKKCFLHQLELRRKNKE